MLAAVREIFIAQNATFALSTAESWSFVLSAVVASATTVYALLTWRLVAETKRLREAYSEPHVGVSVLPSEYASTGFADLVIRNDGLGAAIDLRFIPKEATPEQA